MGAIQIKKELPHMDSDYIPYIWIMDFTVLNMLLYEYHEDKMERLYDAFRD
jgi:hypothetical protein